MLNIGDSRGIIRSDTGKLYATRDHNAYNPREKQRVLALGGDFHYKKPQAEEDFVIPQ